MTNETKPSSKLRPPLSWYGGKFYLAPQIVAQLPPHRIYVEPYGGAASVLLNKPPSPVEVYNDLNHGLYALFRTLRENPQDLVQRLTVTPYDESTFAEALALLDDPQVSLLVRGWAFYVASRMSVASGQSGYSYSVHQSRRGMAQCVSGWLSSIDDNLPRVIERLREVQVMCRPAMELIDRFDSQDTLFYLDPPYLPDTRVAHDQYTHEMTREQHFELSCRLSRLQGKAVLSGYDCPDYARWYEKWRRVDIDVTCAASVAGLKPRRVESLWFNF